MTQDEEKAVQEDNAYFLPEDKNRYAQDMVWVLGVTFVAGLGLLGIFLWEVFNL